MRAELRWVLCADHDPIEEWIPEEPDVVHIALQVFLGPVGEPGEEEFQFIVRTPGWYLREWANAHESAAEIARGGRQWSYVWGYTLIMMPYWDYRLFQSTIEKLCQHVEGKDWNEVGSKLGRYGAWEFDPLFWIDAK